MSISNEPIGNEQSMDEILSSIRKVLKDSETVTVPPEPQGGGFAREPQGGGFAREPQGGGFAREPQGGGFAREPQGTPASIKQPGASPHDSEPVMVLEPSMMVPEAPAHGALASTPTLSSDTPPGTKATDTPYEPQPSHGSAPSGTVETPQPILGAQAAEAAASHIGALMRTVSADRGLTVSRGGISIEDIVREEIRPMLKSWLDAHLPGLVERVVRAEIERLVGRDGF